MKAFGFLTLPTPFVPRTAIALRFLLPITAPTPERPAARCKSLTIAEYKTPFSPERPIEETRINGSWCLVLMAGSVSQTVLPQM